VRVLWPGLSPLDDIAGVVVKHVVKPRCRFGCRFIQVSTNLWLCPHASFGSASYLKGAVEEARAMVEKAGGYEAIVRRLQDQEGQRKHDREDALEQGRVNIARSVRYD